MTGEKEQLEGYAISLGRKGYVSHALLPLLAAWRLDRWMTPSATVRTHTCSGLCLAWLPPGLGPCRPPRAAGEPGPLRRGGGEVARQSVTLAFCSCL